MKAFKDRIEKYVEKKKKKAYLISSIKILDLNEYDKIAFCIEHTGMKM